MTALANAAWRYTRLLGSLARYTLNREMAFRVNFLVKVSVEVLWLGILLAFYGTVFAKTKAVAGWPEAEYMFFVGCFFALNGMIETLFLENCNDFAELAWTVAFIVLARVLYRAGLRRYSAYGG